jgi:hypothetical protein
MSATVSSSPETAHLGIHALPVRRVTGDRLRIFMSSIMRCSGFISAIGAISRFRML